MLAKPIQIVIVVNRISLCSKLACTLALMATLLEFRIPIGDILIEVGGLCFLVVNLDDIWFLLLLNHSYNSNYMNELYQT